MVRRALALVTTALALTAACGTGAGGDRADTPVSNQGPVAVPAGPPDGPRGEDPRCREGDDVTVAAGQGPVTEITPDCSGIDLDDFRAPTTPPGPIGQV